MFLTGFGYTGNYRWVKAMKWSGQPDFEKSTVVQFIVDGKEEGLLKNYGPLTWLKVCLCVCEY